MSKPRVTIGLAVYNGEQTIQRALESLLAQDYPAFHIIVSDNASTDRTRDIVEDYARRDSRVRVDANERNVGAVGNFKKLVEHADTPYFMWAAHDDFWLPDFVSRMVQELEAHRDSGVAFCAVDLVYPDGELMKSLKFVGDDDPNRRSHWKMVQGLLSPRKYNLWFYGLFRTELLRAACRLPDIPAWDRWLMLVVAFGSRFRYVEAVHHLRTVYRPGTRTAHEDGLLAEARGGIAIARAIWEAPFVPPERKTWIPIVLGQYVALRLVGGSFRIGSEMFRRRAGQILRPTTGS